MALINCPERGKEISDKAKSYPNCSCPIENDGMVTIKMPNNVVTGWAGLLSSKNCSVKENDEFILWEGKHGENAAFSISEPKNIIVDLGSWGNPVSGRVEPNKKYSLVQDMWVHMLATYRLTDDIA